MKNSTLYFNHSLNDSTDTHNSELGLSKTDNITAYYGFYTLHIADGESNNDNHSLIIGRLFYIKQKYISRKFFAEFKFSIAIASGYGDYRNLPIGKGLTLGFIPSICAGYRLSDDLELGFDFI